MIRRLIAAALLAGAGDAQAAWQQASSRHFVVYSDDDPERVRSFTERLERYDAAMHVLYGAPELAISPSARVTVYIVRDIGAVQKLAGRGAGNVAGFYDARASGSIAVVPRRGDGNDQYALSANAILFHEYAHHFMFTNYGSSVTPAWLVEGFAEFNATTRIADDGAATIGAPPLYRAYGLLDSGILPMHRLLTADPNTLPGVERQIFYGRAWLLTHYLSSDEQGRRQLSQYLAALNKGRPPLEAAAVLGKPGALDLRLNHYVAGSLKAFVIRAGALKTGPIEVRALSPAEAAVMPARIASGRGVDARSAPGVAALARRSAAPFPDDAAAQNELAEADYDAGDFAGSRAAADRALGADGKSVHALIYRGLAAMAAARHDKVTNPETWRSVRSWFSKANHLDPENPWPLELFYESYVAEGRDPTPNAQSGLVYAHALAPFDVGLCMTAAKVLLQQDKPADARAALEPVAYNPHAGGASKTASALVAAIDKDGVKGGLALIEATPPSDGAKKPAADER